MAQNMKRYLTSNYITAAMLEPGVEYEHTIVEVYDYVFEGDTVPTAIVRFESGEQLSLNQTNLRTIGAGFGWNDANWLGQKIIVYRDENVPYQGKLVPGVRVRVPPAPDRIGFEARRAIGSNVQPLRSGPARTSDDPRTMTGRGSITINDKPVRPRAWGNGPPDDDVPPPDHYDGPPSDYDPNDPPF
jgi:hypothetical protein